jgi:DnaJ-class molecular chaperone
VIEYTDRYGGPANWPNPDTVCPGPCEGMGVYPVRAATALRWSFVTCSDCNGTGRRPDTDGEQP